MHLTQPWFCSFPDKNSLVKYGGLRGTSMDLTPPWFCSVVDKNSLVKYICFCRDKHGVRDVCLTDGDEVWSSEFTKDTREHFMRTFSLASLAEFFLKLSSAHASVGVSVVTHDLRADLHIGPSASDLCVTLKRLEVHQTRTELKNLLFSMTESAARTEGSSRSVSPLKNQQRNPAEFEPRQQNGVPSGTVKKRLPGASLINPGAKKKLRATGVAFDDAEED